MNYQQNLIEYQDNNYLEFENAISLDILSAINSAVGQLRENFGDGGFHLVDVETSSLIAPLLESESFKNIDSICRKITLSTSENRYVFSKDQNEHQVIRCADAKSADISNGRHYDSYLQTILIPLQLAEDTGNNGDLLLYKKNRETFSSSKNIVEKIGAKYTFSSLSKREAKSQRDIESKQCERIKCKLGNLYFFNGFRTKHCNLSVMNGERRSLLLHTYSPVLDFNIGKLMRLKRRLFSRDSTVNN